MMLKEERGEHLSKEEMTVLIGFAWVAATEATIRATDKIDEGNNE